MGPSHMSRFNAETRFLVSVCRQLEDCKWDVGYATAKMFKFFWNLYLPKQAVT